MSKGTAGPNWPTRARHEARRRRGGGHAKQDEMGVYSVQRDIISAVLAWREKHPEGSPPPLPPILKDARRYLDGADR